MNPVRNEKEEDLDTMKELNKTKDILEEEREKLLKQKRDLISMNKKKVDQIRNLR